MCERVSTIGFKMHQKPQSEVWKCSHLKQEVWKCFTTSTKGVQVIYTFNQSCEIVSHLQPDLWKCFTPSIRAVMVFHTFNLMQKVWNNFTPLVDDFLTFGGSCEINTPLVEDRNISTPLVEGVKHFYTFGGRCKTFSCLCLKV